MCKCLLGRIHVQYYRNALYLSIVIVEESNVHANKASQGIEKGERMPLAGPHRELKRELETRTPALQ